MKLYFASLILFAATATARQAAAPKSLLVGGGPPQFPADPRSFISSQQIQQLIEKADADVAAGKMYSGEPLVLEGPFRATLEWRNTAQSAVHVHETDAELFVILEGSGTMMLGGTLVDPKPANNFAWEGRTLTAAKADGGTAYKVAKGDVILIPPKTAHTVSQVDGKLILWSMHLPMPDSVSPSSLKLTPPR